MMIELATQKADAIRRALKTLKTQKATARREEARRDEEKAARQCHADQEDRDGRGRAPTQGAGQELTELPETVAAMK